MTDPLDTEETRIFQAPWSQGPRTDPVVKAAQGGAEPARALVAAPRELPPRAARPTVVPPPAQPEPASAPARPNAPLPPPGGVPTASPMFRHEALRAYSQGRSIASPLEVAPLGSRILFFALLLMAASALVLAAVGHVELTSLGRGVLRAPEGVQPVTAPLAGVVAEVLVENGATVAPGQVLLRIDSTQLRAQLQDAERKLAAIAERQADEARQAERLYQVSARKLKKRHALIERRIHSQHRGVNRLAQRAERFRALSEEGLEGQGSVEEAGEALDNAERSWLALQDQLALADVELSRLDREREASRSLRREEIVRAESERDGVKLLLGQTEIRASRPGKVEGLHVTVGQQLVPGTSLARLVPTGKPREVVAFMPERDRAFLQEGRSVRLELDRLPVGEFGSLGARVVRISNDVATEEELTLHLGQRAEGTYFRVDLTLEADRAERTLEPYLQSGALVTVRAPLRSRRILSLMFDPIRRFLD